MRHAIRFYLGETFVTLDDLSPTLTLLDWLRGQGRTGTKEGCNEGDCGACMVIVVRLRQGRLVAKAVNACIQLVAMLDGACLFTVEDIGTVQALHPVQKAMVELGGSQCGFCTPGFVMSMVAYRLSGSASADDASIDAALAGNLCRCTGYAPIVKAMKQALMAPDSPFEHRIASLVPRLEAMQDLDDVEVVNEQGRFVIPASADSLAAMFVANPELTLVAGATDVGLWITKGMRSLPEIALLGQCPDLATIALHDDTLHIGAAVTYDEARLALCAFLPEFGALIGRIGSTPIRNSATVCGNIANGSPIGDGPPALIVAGAKVHLRRGDVRRILPLEDYFLAYGVQDRQSGEFVEKLSVPRQNADSFFRIYKISKRFDQDISAVLGAFSLACDSLGRIVHARFAFGGMAATPCRARRAEEALLGAEWNRASLAAAREALTDDFSPLDDMRASAWYRREIAANLLTRFFEEYHGETLCLEKSRGLTHV